MHRIYNNAKTRLLSFLPYSTIFCSFCHILPTIAICGQYAAIYSNMLFVATCNILLYSARVLLYFTKVGLYKVSRMWWEWVVMCKVL